MKFKMFSDKRYLPEGARHLELLNPFWGEFDDPQSVPASAAVNLWRRDFLAVDAFITLVDDPREADFALLPGDWKQYRRRKRESLAHDFAKKVSRYGKPLLVIYQHDSAERIPLNHAVVLRTSLVASKKAKNEYAMPAWHTDYVREYSDGALRLNPKGEKPLVGFCGHVLQGWGISKGPQLQQSLYRLLRGDPWFDYLKFRQSVLSCLSQHAGLETNFILRDQFMGDGLSQAQKWSGFQQEFIENLLTSEYIVCMRGAGNYSFRFYEALCCGRIPVLVDTDCVLPFEDQIDWQKYIIRVGQRQLAELGDQIVDFHQRISADDFLALQTSLRELSLKWFSPTGYFSNILRVLFA